MGKTFKVFTLIGVIALNCSAWAAGGGGGGGAGTYMPVLELGANVHSGDTGKSLSGAMEYLITFRAEQRKGFWRPTVAADLGYATGQASVGGATPDFTLASAGFTGGVYLFPGPGGRFQPFIGGSGVLAWNFLKLPVPPTGVEPNTQGLSYGYEVSAGVDLRFWSMEGTAFRVRGGLWNVTSTLAGISGFQLTGFRILLGITY